MHLRKKLFVQYFITFITLICSLHVMAQDIGVAKNATLSGREITLDFYLENFGTGTLTSVALAEDLDAAFGAGNYLLLAGPSFADDPGTISLNGGFNGSGDTALISSGSLNIGDTAQIQILIEITTFADLGMGLGIYSNQVTVSGMSIGPQMDVSDNGTDPDPNGNGDPTEVGENDPTIIDFFARPLIGAAKHALLSGTQVTMDFYLENFGNRDLSSLTLPDNLDAVFGAGNYVVIAPPALLDDPGTIIVNGGFDGSGDTALISSGSLSLGDTAQIRILVNVTTVTDQGNGFGSYSNQVIVSGQSSSGILTSDLSDSGTEPDSNGDNDPKDPDEDDPTLFVIGQEPQIGVAKTATVINSLVTFDYFLENLGNENLNNLSLPDDLDAVFGAGNYQINAGAVFIDDPGTITLNNSFDGMGDTQLIQSGTLGVGDTAQIQLVVLVTALSDQGLGSGNYRNQVTLVADGDSGGVTTDLSTDNVDPDPNGNGDPNESGENVPTDFTVAEIAVIGVAKTVAVLPFSVATLDVGGVIMGGAGPRVVAQIRLENLGNVTLSNITLTDDLDAVFGAGNYGTVSSAQFPEILDDPGTLVRNSNYNGSTDTNILNAGSFLVAGETALIQFEIIVLTVTDQGLGIGVYQNQATGGGDGPSGMTTDLSDSGPFSDPNGNGNPNEAGENDPTQFTIGSFIGVAKNATVNTNQVTIDLYLENFGTITLSDISLTDNLDTVFGAGNYAITSAPSFIDDPGTLILNPGFDGSTNEDFLSPGGTLVGGDTAQIRFIVTVSKLTTPDFILGKYTNQALVSALQPGGSQLLDASEAGIDPDPNGNSNPTDFTENDPTVFFIVSDAVVGVAKDANISGNQVTVDLYLENFGTMTSTSLTLVDDLNSVFGVGNYIISSAPSLIVDPGTLVLNPGFNGAGDTGILAAGSSLGAGVTAQMQFVVDVTNIVDNQGLGVGVYANQATVTGVDSVGIIVCDLSDDGIDPDPDGDNDPTNPGLADPPVPGENDPTRFFLGNASLGAAFHATVMGTVITFDYYLENLGDVTIDNIQIVDQLFTTFGFGNFVISQAPVLLQGPATLSLIAAFDGTFVSVLLSDGSLAPGETARVQFGIDVTNVTDQGMGLGVYSHQFNVTGTDPSGGAVADGSDNGIDPDPNGNGDATEAGENDPTLMVIGEEPNVGVAKNATTTGSQVTFDIYLENLGNVTLGSMTLVEDLDGVFGAGNYTISTAPNFIDNPGTIILNAGFDGSGNTALISAGSTLVAADTAQIRMIIDITTILDQGFGTGFYQNQVMVSATGPSATVSQDLSDDGTDPDPNGNGNPGDIGESDPTLFTLGITVVGTAKTATVVGDMVTFDFYIENLGTDLLTNFSMSEDLNAIFGAGNYTLVSGPTLISSVRDLVLSTTYDGMSDTQLIASGTMASGIIEQFRIVVQVARIIDGGSGLGVYTNQVTVSAENLAGGVVSDLSDDGTDPDPNGDGNPTQAGENDATAFTIAENPVIGVAKAASVDGRTVTMDVYLEAFGNVDLSSVSVIDDLDAVFGGGNYSVIIAPAFIVDPGTLGINGAFNGSASPEMLLAGSTLLIGATAQIRFTVLVTTVTDQGFGAGIYQNVAVGSGMGPGGTLGTDLSDDGTDPDPNGNNDPTEAGENDPTAIILEGNIGDRFWNDLNGDGIQDGGEPGLAGITVYIDVDNSGDRAIGEPVATTDAGGNYDLTNLAAGMHTVRIEPITIPSGFVLTTANLPLVVNLGAGEDFNDADFGYQQQNATIGDFLFNDFDGNGADGGGKGGLFDVQVYLDLNNSGDRNAGEPVTRTDIAGLYDFTGLAAGTYTVNIEPSTLPLGFVLTTGNLPFMATIAAGEDFNDADFGFQQQNATIGDFVWNDLNGDGIQDGGEPGIAAVMVYLDLNSNIVFDVGEPTATTNGAGAYDITGLATGTYAVRVEPTTIPMGFNLTTANLPQMVTIAAGEDFNSADIGYQQQDATIGDFVWNDLNGNGLQDGGEPGLGGVTVYTDLNTNGMLDAGEPMATTDGLGSYAIINLATGTYVVNIDPTTLPAGSILITANLPMVVVLAAGQDFNDADFGYQRQDGMIGDFVWNDLNGDGVQDGGEPGLANVTLDLIDDTNGNGVIDGGEMVIGMVTTNGTGGYTFTGLAVGDYIVNLTDTNNVLTAYVQTGGINPQAVSLIKGGINSGIDFGFQRQDGTMGDFVWNDLNGDGVQDGGEPGFANVTLDLIDDANGNGMIDGGEAVLATETTDGMGAYDFVSLTIGDYLVNVTDTNNVLTSYVLTGGTNPLAVALVKGQDFNDADFGFQREDGTIGDLVWHDLNANGLFDLGEPGIANVSLDLIDDANGNGVIDGGESVLDTQTTDMAGAYSFAGLTVGNYIVEVTDTNLVLDGFILTSGTEPLAVTLAKAENFAGADFGYLDERARIGIAKNATATTLMIVYTFHVENFGTVELSSLSMLEDLDAVFGVGVYVVADGPTVVGGNGVNASGNPAFNGSSDTELFAANSSLGVGEFIELEITIEVTDPPEPINGPVSYTNQVTVTAIGVSGNSVSDESTDGNFPDPDGNGDPGDNGTPTLIYLPLPVPTLSEWGLIALFLGLVGAAIWIRRRDQRPSWQ